LEKDAQANFTGWAGLTGEMLLTSNPSKVFGFILNILSILFKLPCV
jgi:hypothetical protein